MIYQYKNFGLEIKDVDKKEGIVSGYFSAFNIKDADGDLILPGAFTKSIQENGPESQRPRIKHLLNHNPGTPLGVITELKEDDYGLKYTSTIGKHSTGADFMKMVESGLITEHSIGFKVIKEKFNKEKDYNEMSELKLYEGSSLTGWGANEFTPLTSVKGDVSILNERLKMFEKFVRNTDASDETIDLCLIEIKQLTAMIERLTQPVQTVVPNGIDKLKLAVYGLIKN
jgi:hypothetical protein